MTAILSDIIGILNELAPPSLAEEWDNVGLQIGRPDWPIRSIWVALDPSPVVIHAACNAKIDLLVTHHPLMLTPIRNIDFRSTTGAIIRAAAVHQLAVFSAHTNLDSVKGGVNDVLADMIGLSECTPMIRGTGENKVKLVLFVPEDYEETILEALFQTAAGHIGEYSCCAFIGRGHGTFLPGKGTRPFVGESGALTRVAEVRIETVVPEKELSQVLAHVRRYHPYETMAYDVYPLAGTFDDAGIGRFGVFGEAMPLETLAVNLKRKMNLPWIRFIGRKDLTVTNAALCSGSGSSLISRFLASKADVLISGDLRYHDARTIEEAGRGAIDIGHFASEQIILKPLADKLRAAITGKGYPVMVDACSLEKDPFWII
ncbi:MAG: Nif3-like dinuclear metal center hexameric protein [Thermodesulfobacteriota bacterium]